MEPKSPTEKETTSSEETGSVFQKKEDEGLTGGDNYSVKQGSRAEQLTAQREINTNSEETTFSETIDSETRRKKQIKSKWLVFLDVVAQYAVPCVFIAGFIVGLVEYWDAKQDRRIQASLDLVTDWEEQGFIIALAVLENRILDLRSEGLKILGDTAEEDKNELLTNYARNKIEAEISPKEIQSFERLIYFFNKAGHCMTSEICDETLLVDFFGHASRTIWSYYRPEIQSRRQFVADYARYTEIFAKISQKAATPQ